MFKRSLYLSFGMGVIGIAACSSGGGAQEQSMGELSMALSLAEAAHDVQSLHYEVFPRGEGCSGVPLDEATVNLEGEALPASVQPSGGGDTHRFGDALFVLPAGDYHVCVTPLNADGEASAACAAAEGDATVVPEETTEILLVSQCIGEANGGLDVITTLNDPPTIDDLTLGPSKFITQCEDVALSATATDPNGDDVSYAWAVTGGPGGASLAGAGASATFTPNGAGDYEVTLTVTDVYGGTTSLAFPVHVSAAECGGGGECELRPTVMLCNNSGRDVTTFFPAGSGLTLVLGCTPDASTQALMIARSGQGAFDETVVRNYVQAGGLVLTEFNISDEVFNAVFSTAVMPGPFGGNCSDAVQPSVQFNTSDTFWLNNPGIGAPLSEGCGQQLDGYPGITPLAGWANGGVSLAYRDFGDGRVWLIESDWQDNEMIVDFAPSNQLMGYMLTHGRVDCR